MSQNKENSKSPSLRDNPNIMPLFESTIFNSKLFFELDNPEESKTNEREKDDTYILNEIDLKHYNDLLPIELIKELDKPNPIIPKLANYTNLINKNNLLKAYRANQANLIKNQGQVLNQNTPKTIIKPIIFLLNNNCMLFPNQLISQEIIKNNARKHNGHKKLEERQGDWVCPRCQNLNFSFRSICNRCRLNKNEAKIKSQKS